VWENLASVTVTRHSQVTIPKEIREAVGIIEGDRVQMKVVEGNKIMIEKQTKTHGKTAQIFCQRTSINC
jgi:AbrB family looped-hinge helix DNA binding protein